MTKTRYLWIGLIAALCLNACILDNADEDKRSCTLIYCEDSITLTAIDRNMGTPVESFKGTVTTGGTTTAIECNVDKRSGPGYDCFGPNSVKIKGAPSNSVIVNIAGEPEEIIRLTPITREPNGPGCGFCTQASATMKVTNACTLIGCDDHIKLTLVDEAQQPITEFSGAVIVGDTRTELTCDATNTMGTNYTCAGNTLEVKGTPGSMIDVDLSAGGKVIKQQVMLTPTTTQPNGPGCSPICSSADATLTLQ